MKLDTIVCMDALEYMRGLGDASVDMIITDLPYGVTSCDWDIVIPFVPMWAAIKRILKPRGVFVTTATEPFASHLRMSNIDWYKYDWVWDKQRMTNPFVKDYRPLPAHEQILVFGDARSVYYPQMKQRLDNHKRKLGISTKSGIFGKPNTFGDVNGRKFFYPTTILRVPGVRPHTGEVVGHPTQKPVALFEYLIKTYTQPGDIVLDPFIGSGTTAVAARKTGRHYIGCDLSPEYVAIANKRLQDTDPYQPTQVDEHTQQLSLFGD